MKDHAVLGEKLEARRSHVSDVGLAIVFKRRGIFGRRVVRCG